MEKMDEITKDEIKKIEKLYNIKVVRKPFYKYKMNVGALAYSDLREIHICYTIKNRREALNLIFHELGHQYCYDNNKFVNYHKMTTLAKIKKIAVRAERYVEKIAAKLLNSYDSSIPYEKIYDTKEAQQELLQYHIDYANKRLDYFNSNEEHSHRARS